MMPLNPNPDQGAFGFMRIALTLAVIICMAFPAMALGQSSGDEYVGQKTEKQFNCENPGPLSCPYPPSPPPIAEGAPMYEKGLPSYQRDLVKEDPDEYYHSGKLPAQPTVPKGE